MDRRRRGAGRVILQPSSRESGMEFSVGCFLLALGFGLLVPRPGLGLYSLVHAGGHAWLWSTCMVGSGFGLIATSYFRCPVCRLVAVIMGLSCWIALGFRFVDGNLWGAAMQAVVAVFLLNACLFRLITYLRGRHD